MSHTHDSIYDDPELAELIGEGISGAASSPTIVQNAANSDHSPKLEDTIRNLLEEADQIVHHENKTMTAPLPPPPTSTATTKIAAPPPAASATTTSPPATVTSSSVKLQTEETKTVKPEKDDLITDDAVNGILAMAEMEVAAQKPTNATAADTKKPPTISFVAPPSSATATATQLYKPNNSAASRSNGLNAFSMEEEDTILRDILKSIENGDDIDDADFESAAAAIGGGLGGTVAADGTFQVSQVDLELEAALEYAERIVASSGNDAQNAQGTPVLRTQEIASIKTELEKARTTAGAPCCVDNCLKWVAQSSKTSTSIGGGSLAARPVIAIGTTLGMILLFNMNYKMCGVCGTGMAPTTESKGATTAISFSRAGTTIVAGYEGGQVTLWDTDTLHPLKTFEGEFPTAVNKISFCHPDSSKFVGMDSYGTIKVFHVNSVMGKHVGRSVSIHTGYEDPCSDMAVTSDQIALLNANGQPDGVKEFTYVATVCGKQLNVFVVAFGIQLSISLAFTSAAPKRGASNPIVGQPHELVSWIEDQSQRKLVACWTNIFEVYHVLSDCSGQVTLQRTAQFEAPHTMIASSALDGCCILFASADAHLHVFDASHNTIVQTVQFKGQLDLVTFQFPNPPELTVSGHTIQRKRTCHFGQMSHNGGTVTLQGRSRFAQVFLKTWEERVNDLLYAGQWDDLFALAKDLSQDMAVAVVGLSTAPAQRKANIHKRIEELMNLYITQMDTQLKKPTSSANEHLIPIIEKIITFCSDTQLQELYFSSVMPKLDDLRASDRGLYALEKALNSGKFNTIPSVYISNFAKLFRSPGRFATVNRPDEMPTPPGMSVTDYALKRMEIALTRVTNDLDLLMTTAEALKLYRLACSILSFRQHKYVEALQFVLPNPEKGSDGSIEVAFDYVENLFNDKSLVDNEPIIPWYRKTAKENVIAFLATDPRALNEMLKHDPTRLLNIASNLIAPTYASTSSSPLESAPRITTSSAESNSPWTASAKVTRSEFAGAIYAQMIDLSIPPNKPWEYERKKWPPYGAILLTYVCFATPFANDIISFPTKAACDDFTLRAAYHFTYAFDKANLERRNAITAACVRLINSSRWTDSMTPAIENEAKSKRLGKVHASLLAVRGCYNDAVACFLSREYNQVDPYLSKHVFQFITTEMKHLQQKSDANGIEDMRGAVKAHLSSLIHIDAIQLSQLVFEHLPDDHGEVFRALQGIGDNTFLLYIRGMIAKGDKTAKEDKYTQNVYIGLLCKHEPAAVYEYLVKNDSEIQYDLGQALHDCQRYSVTDAIIFLLEKMMQIAQAMETLMASITEHLNNLRQSVIQNPAKYADALFPADGSQQQQIAATNSSSALKSQSVPNPSIARAVLYDNDKVMDALSEEDEKLIKMVNLGIDLCTRYYQKIGTEDLMGWWFRLLDRFGLPKRLLHERQTNSKDVAYHHNPNVNTPVHGYEDNEVGFKGNFPYLSRPLSPEGHAFLVNMQCIYGRYVSHILTAMVKTLPLSTVVGKIIADNQQASFGPFKPIIVGILETLSFDLEANRLCKLCADGDTLLIASELKRTATSAIVPSSSECGICSKHLSVVIGDVDSLRLYPCGHGYHEICCGTLTQCYICSDYEEHYGEGAIGGRVDDDLPAPNKEAARSVGSSAAKKSAEPQNIDFTLRKLRQVRGKLDNTRIYKDMLSSILKGDSGGNRSGQSKEKVGGGIIVDGVNISDIDTSAFGGANNLLLAPPRAANTLALSEILEDAHKAVVVNTSRCDEELTDADLIAIFGKQAYESMKRSADEESAHQRNEWAENVNNDNYDDREEEWAENDAMKQLMEL